MMEDLPTEYELQSTFLSFGIWTPPGTCKWCDAKPSVQWDSVHRATLQLSGTSCNLHVPNRNFLFIFVQGELQSQWNFVCSMARIDEACGQNFRFNNDEYYRQRFGYVRALQRPSGNIFGNTQPRHIQTHMNKATFQSFLSLRSSPSSVFGVLAFGVYNSGFKA